MKRSVNLMLGDKVGVFTRDSYYTITSLGVTLLDRNDAVRVEGISEPLFVEEILPIKLTNEILRKNGFIQNEFYANDFCLKSNERTVELQKLEEGCYEIFRSIEIHYVHELQHALRMLGLHEVADSFKVK